MSKPVFVISCPIDTYSGYGARSRDIVKAIIEMDRVTTPCAWDENGKPTMFSWDKGPKDTSEFDSEGYKKHSERITNGTILFGKYYRGLWD